MRPLPQLMLALLLAACLAYGADEPTLDGFIQERGRHLLDTPQRTFLLHFKDHPLTWNTEDKTQVRFDIHSAQEIARRRPKMFRHHELRFGGAEVVEAVFQFTDHLKLQGIQLSVYKRGACGDWPEEKFNRTLKRMQACLGELTGARSPEASQRRIERSRISQMLYRTMAYDAVLRWSKDGEQTEYITVQFAERGSVQSLKQDMRTDVEDRRRLVHNLRKEAGGDRWIEVPMVNQGQKGYCVDAVVERFMKYYNSSVDQHILAQILATDPTQGTDLYQAIDTLKANSHKLKIKLRTLYEDDTFHTVPDLQRFVGKFNSAAKKEHKRQIPDQMLRGQVDANAVLAMMDEGIFMRLRRKRSPGADKFQEVLKAQIDSGTPILWSVILFPSDQEQQTGGFHARIINGYNEKTDEVIYTDTWGPGHEKKRMKASRAWAISTMLVSISPTK